MAIWLGLCTSVASAAFPGRDGALLHADLLTDAQQKHATYMRTRSLLSSKEREWLPCTSVMAFACGSTLTPDVGNSRYSPDGQRIAVALTGAAFGPPGGVGLLTMSASGPSGYATAATFAALPGIAAIAWSADGSRLVAERGGSLVLLTSDGVQVGPLVPNATSPDWSSRGQIAFVRDGNIWIVRPGQPPRQLTRSGGASPSWAPDGRSLAFVRNDHLFSVRRDGKRLRRITTRVASLPVWSPSGRSLAFVSNSDLYVVRADGKKIRRLLNYDPPNQAGFNASIKALDWRPLPM